MVRIAVYPPHLRHYFTRNIMSYMQRLLFTVEHLLAVGPAIWAIMIHRHAYRTILMSSAYTTSAQKHPSVADNLSPAIASALIKSWHFCLTLLKGVPSAATRHGPYPDRGLLMNFPKESCFDLMRLRQRCRFLLINLVTVEKAQVFNWLMASYAFIARSVWLIH